jgi:hypothetical protein
LFHKGITLLGAGVLAASVIAVPVSASAADPDVTSAITGQIEGSDGSAFAAGTPVVLWSTPSQDALAAAQVGDSFVNTPIASGVVGSSGSFSVPISDVSSLSKFASKDGLLNLEVRAADGTDVAPFALSRKIVTVDGTTALVDPSDLSNSKATTATTAQVAAANKPAKIAATKVPKSVVRKTARAMAAVSDELPVDPQDPSQDPSDGSGGAPLDPSQETPEPTTGTGTGGVGPNSPSSTQVCGEDYMADLGSRKVIVGSSYANAGSTTGTFTYSSGASSTIGVGYSVSGSKGSYSQSGTSSTSSNGSVGFGTRSGGYSYATYFKFGKYGSYCYPVGSKKNIDSYYAYKVRPSSYAGGGTVNSSTTPSATKCTDFGGGTTITRNSNGANTWSSGASLDAVIGIDLSSKTGYTSTAKLSYKNNGSTKKICGTNDYLANSQRLVTK